MPSILPGHQYDIFISYRQKDNKTGWVTEFVESLRNEIEATFKEDISIYFDANPHDGLHETHDVDGSLKEKVKCLIFIPIVSQTYCDPASFAWQNELMPFLEFVRQDEHGLDVRLPSGNVSKRVLPVRIHEIDEEDQKLFEDQIDGVMRPVDFIYKEAGVNRPLKISDDKRENSYGTDYHNQVNKVANAIKELIQGLSKKDEPVSDSMSESMTEVGETNLSEEIKRRGVLKAGLLYILTSLLLWKVIKIGVSQYGWSSGVLQSITLGLVILFPIAILLAWLYEFSPGGLIRTGSAEAKNNPYSDKQKKPLTSNVFLAAVTISVIALFVFFPSENLPESDMLASESSIAVIPFRNNTGDVDNDHIGVGIASEVRTQLALTKQFDFITAEQSTVKYQNSDDAPTTIGAALNTTHIITGNYQIAGDQIKIAVELIDGRNGSIIWNFPYVKSLANVFALQTDIATKVVDHFGIKKEVVKAEHQVSLDAYKHYAQGMKIFNESRHAGRRLEAIKEFDKAIALDSGFIDAWDMKIATYQYAWFNNYNDSIINPEFIKKHIDYVKQNLPESWRKTEIIAGYTYQVLKDYDKALKLFLEIYDEYPDSYAANAYISAIYKRNLQSREALRFRQRAVKLNPAAAINWGEIATIFRQNGDYENVKKANENLFEMDPEDGGLYFDNRHVGKIENTPRAFKSRYRSRYILDSLFQSRNYTAVIHHLDTLKSDSTFGGTGRLGFEATKLGLKAYTYYMMDMPDSARKYAQERLANPLANYSYVLNLLDGTEEDMVRDFRRQSRTPAGVDKSQEARLWRSRVEFHALKGNYEEATRLLKEMNLEFPEWGDYVWLNHPEYDAIKKEYPAFVSAINNLILPPKIMEENQLKM